MRRTFSIVLLSCTTLAPTAPATTAGEPSVPGYIVDTYAMVDLPLRLALDDDTLYVGINVPEVL